MSKAELLITLLKKAVNECYERDKCLIDRSMEQASVARIFYYLQRAIDKDGKFVEYNLDCEYNKNKQHIKNTPRCPKGTRPDIVLHKRWKGKDDRYSQDNLLVLEFKPRKAKIKKYKDTGKSIDFVKLEDFTKEDVYNYFLGVFVKLNKRKAEYTFFQDGQEKVEGDLRDE